MANCGQFPSGTYLHDIGHSRSMLVRLRVFLRNDDERVRPT